MKPTRLFVIASVTLFFSGCTKDDFCNCLKGTGATTTESRSIEPFTTIHMSQDVDVYYHVSNEFRVEVTCGKNLIDGITTEVNDNTLQVKNINRCNWLRDLHNQFRIDVYGNNLEHINTYGAGNFQCSDTLTTEKIRVESWDGTGAISMIVNNKLLEVAMHTGPIDMEFKGRTNHFAVYTAGNGYIVGRELNSNYSNVSNYGTGDVTIYSPNQISIYIYYTGNIIYYGDPEIIQSTIEGKGKLIKG